MNSLTPVGAGGWFKAMRGNDAPELIRKNPNAFALAYIIAHRARWREGFNADGLEQGEALLGDYHQYGMTRQEYRTALKHLCEGKFATTRTTNDGTIARLIDTRLFDPLNLAGNQQDNHQPTTWQPPANQQATNNEEGKKRKIEELKSDSIKDSLASLKMTPESRKTIELMEMCKTVLGADEMSRWHKRWLGRAEREPEKLFNVLAEVKTIVARDGIKKSPAKAAEDLWKRWPAK